MPAMYKTEQEWYKKDLERYYDMPREQRQKIINQINDLEKKYTIQLTRIQNLKAFFIGEHREKKKKGQSK